MLTIYTVLVETALEPLSTIKPPFNGLNGLTKAAKAITYANIWVKTAFSSGRESCVGVTGPLMASSMCARATLGLF